MPDDGRLTDGQGRTVDFSNTLIIPTANLGSQYLARVEDGQSVESVEPQEMEIVRGHMTVALAVEEQAAARRHEYP